MLHARTQGRGERRLRRASRKRKDAVLSMKSDLANPLVMWVDKRATGKESQTPIMCDLWLKVIA